MSPEEIAGAAYQAGFRGPALTTAVAIALAESRGNPGAIGDVNLQGGQWGPSVGLWQIRSLVAQDHTGGPRDRFADTDPLANARAAFAISGGGQNFGPWSTFNNDAYQHHMPAAQHGVDAFLAAGGGSTGAGVGAGAAAAAAAGVIAAAAGTYVVQSGDSLSAIGEHYGIDWQQIAAANPQISDRNLIFPGQVLVIPVAPPAPQPVATLTPTVAPPVIVPTPNLPPPATSGAARIFVDTRANRQLASEVRRHGNQVATARLALLRAESHVGPPPASVEPVKASIRGLIGQLANVATTLQRQAEEVAANADALDREEGVTTGIGFIDRILSALFNPLAFGVAAGQIKWPDMIWEVDYKGHTPGFMQPMIEMFDSVAASLVTLPAPTLPPFVPTPAPGGSLPVVPPAPVVTPPPASPPASPSTPGATEGKYQVPNSAAVAKAQQELAGARANPGGDGPLEQLGDGGSGQCYVGVVRWLHEAGIGTKQPFTGGGPLSALRGGGGVEIPVGQIASGDVVQIIGHGAADSWYSPHIHTYLVTGVHHQPDGSTTYDWIDRNFDNHGHIAEHLGMKSLNFWAPSTDVHVFRFGQV